MEKYKTELRIFHREKKEFQDNKAKVFAIILGQCTHNVKNKLENEFRYATLEMNDDVVGLLRQLKKMLFASGGVQHPFWTLQIVMRRLLAINQGPRESVTHYYRQVVSTYSRIDGEVQDRTPDFPPREERITRQQSKGVCYHSRTVHSQCEEQIVNRIRICYLGNE
jgi:hypothetical protein